MNNNIPKENGHKDLTGIIVALPRELQTLGYHGDSKKGMIRHSNHVSIFLSGMGTKNAISAAEQLVQNGANRLVSWGTAAALSPDITAGTLLLPKCIITENQIKIPTNPLRNNLLEQLASIKTIYNGSLCTASEVLSDTKQKTALMNRMNAKATDMESGGIAKIAQKYSVPFTVIRAVSDSSEMIIPESILLNTTADGFADIPNIVKQAMVSPKDWLPMIKLYYNFGKAQQTLKKVAQTLLPYLSKTGHLTKNLETKG